MISREEIQKHWTDAEWLLEHGLVSRRSSEDWQPIEKAVPDVGLCWLTIELEYGDRYVKKEKLSDEDIQRGIRREHPCPVAFMPCEIEPEPYKNQ